MRMHCGLTQVKTGAGCNKGYKGNPYLSLGCEDIDECEIPDLNDCDIVNGKCINTPGSYNCSCNPHYDGDGKSSPDGQGCTAKASQFPVIKFSLGLSFGFLTDGDGPFVDGDGALGKQ
ncbi:hypothetical protein Vadar_007071 [Vaccinium darrowii]|uniref:Uncharacterized protein n=1 Tax=Vaccinium darrowii TaxID=229202 RepID=A0ACB7XNY7_9ERIC|nr:hypothetical protein Vadar_007071 [Vaccinium darrowii]